MKAWHAPAGRSNKAKLGRRQGFALHACLHCERGPFPHAHGVQCACCSAQSACQGRGAASKASHSNKRSRGGGTHPQTSHSEKRGSSGPISNSGITCSLVGPMGVMYCSMPPRMISHLRARRRPGSPSKQAELCVPRARAIRAFRFLCARSGPCTRRSLEQPATAPHAFPIVLTAPLSCAPRSPLCNSSRC